MKFKNSLFQEQFDEVGFVKVPLLNNEEVFLLKEYITEKTPIIEKTNQLGFFQGVCIDDKQTKINLDNHIRSIINPKLTNVIENFKEIIYTALAKGCGENSKLELHQDSSFVDENIDFSMSLWIPLSDSNLANGAIHFLNGSHKSFPAIRCATISHNYGNINKIKQSMECIDVKQGEALLFNARMLHYTPNNTSGEIRMAIMSCLIRSDADILQYYKISESRLEAYKMKDNFFLDYENFMEEIYQKPKGEKIGEVDFVPFNAFM